MAGGRNDMAELGKNTRFKAGAKQVEIARQGGIASQRVQREKRTRAKTVSDILSNGLSKRQRAQIESAIGGLDDRDATVFTMMVAGMVKAAFGGNVRAFEVLTSMASEAEHLGGNGDVDELTKSLRELARSL